jgi:KDO2-lipid IV(A) lauroyltransferase
VSSGSILLKIFQKCAAPGWRATAMAKLVHRLLCSIAPRKGVALSNMENSSFPSSESWRNETLSGVYNHIAWMLSEYLVLVDNPRQALDWVVDIEGESILQDLFMRQKGAVILTAHLGNWELLAAWLCQRGYPLYAVVRDPDDSDIADLIEEYRSRVGLRTLKKRFIMKEAVRLVQSGAFLGLLADQDGGPSGISSTFLGKKCSTVNGPAAISLMADVPIVPVISYRIAPFHHQIIVSPPLLLPEEGKRKERIEAITLTADTVIEKMVYRHPEQWLWLHRRWHTSLP